MFPAHRGRDPTSGVAAAPESLAGERERDSQSAVAVLLAPGWWGGARPELCAGRLGVFHRGLVVGRTGHPRRVLKTELDDDGARLLVLVQSHGKTHLPA
jgi:hypothetical protein